MRKLSQYVIVACLLALASVQCAHAAPPYSWPKNSVLPIYLVPTDWDINSAEVQAEKAALNDAMQEIQQFYARALGGNTFIRNDLVLVQANQPKEAYGIHWTGGNIYVDGVTVDVGFEGNVVQELYDRGFPTPPKQNEDGYSVIIFVKGAGGYAAGRKLKPGDGGWGIVGDWAIDSIQGQLAEGDYPWGSGQRLQVAVTAKLLGFTFALVTNSSEPDGHLMGNYWQYPNVGFSDAENDQLNRTKAHFFSQCQAITAPVAAPAIKPYELVLLPTLTGDSRALHINEKGLISGFSETSPGLPHHVLFSQGGTQIIDLGAGGGANGAATGVNDNGIAVGFWESISGVRRATRSSVDPIPNTYVTRELIQPHLDDAPSAHAINNGGLIVGASRPSAGQALLWFNDSVRGGTFGRESSANAVNNSDRIAGTVLTDLGRHGFVWNDLNGDGVAQPGEWADIGVTTTIPTAFSEALAINDEGELAGSVDDGGLGHRYAFRLTPGGPNKRRDIPDYFVDSGRGTNALITVLGRLGRGPDAALGINIHGATVGRSASCAGPSDMRATLWKDGNLIDLNDQVTVPAGVTLVSADSINNVGEIVGTASTPGGTRGYLLRPLIPVPPQPTTAQAVGHLIVLKWNDMSSNESGFQIERAELSASGVLGAWAPLIGVAPNIVTYEDTTVTAGTTYQYRIRAFNDAGASDYKLWPTVTARVNRRPVARDDNYSLHEDAALSVVAKKGLLANDTDVDGDPLSIVRIASKPRHGELQWAADGSFTYTPRANYAGTDRFEYVVSDGVAQDRATVSLTIANVPDAPVTRDNNYSTTRNRRLCVSAPGVLANDRDADGDALRAELDKRPQSGTVQLHRDGSFCYRPKSGFVGKDRFTYWAIDTTGRKDQGTVTIHVNKP